MTQEPKYDQPAEGSNERAVAWARQAMANKRAEQKRMAEEYKTNYKLQAALAKLRSKNAKTE
ncbi:hypothetical protein [Spirosoma spitsbergense]|jgi:hypothetical protein|uniref:hypothetical protein n=1 Tax=Spirosoma spitsbergense TaxID=431554 RepID=UPI00036DB3AC|nr:hypothetical protein [Spirosoma spitsbergense]